MIRKPITLPIPPALGREQEQASHRGREEAVDREQRKRQRQSSLRSAEVLTTWPAIYEGRTALTSLHCSLARERLFPVRERLELKFSNLFSLC